MRRYWVLSLLGILWCLPGATCSVENDPACLAKDMAKYPEWYAKIRARNAKLENPAPVWNGALPREDIVTERYVPKDLKKSPDTVIMQRAPASAAGSVTPGTEPTSTEGTDKSNSRLRDQTVKPTNWKASR